MQYQVTTLQDLTDVIIPHFNKFPLITSFVFLRKKKTKRNKADIELFKLVIEIMNRKDHITIEGFKKKV